MFGKVDSVPWAMAIPQVKIKITVVLIAVARLLLISLIPIFAKIEVKAAKMADKKAATYHVICNYLTPLAIYGVKGSIKL